jgi:hypothetical protein
MGSSPLSAFVVARGGLLFSKAAWVLFAAGFGFGIYVRVRAEGGSVNRCFKTPVITANAGYRKGLSRKLGYGKIAALFLHIPTSHEPWR